MPRKRHVSRNQKIVFDENGYPVMPRKRHVSRNFIVVSLKIKYHVMPRKRHVSRNDGACSAFAIDQPSCLARGM